jgi:hypothetical protein
MARRWLIVLVGALGLGACVSGGIPRERVEAWVGRADADLVREWGTPTREVMDTGQRVLIYEEMERTGSATFAREVSGRWGPSGPAPTQSTVGYYSYARSYLFWVDGAGKIVRTEIRQP